MTDQVAKAKAALLDLLHGQDALAPGEIIDRLKSEHSLKDIETAMKIAIGRNEIGLDDDLKFAATDEPAAA